MNEDSQPRKLRLLVKGKEKVDSLFRRKKKAKKTEEGDQHADEDDFEDEVPILSRIADPAMAQPLRLKPKANNLTNTNRNHAEQLAQGDNGEMQINMSSKPHSQAAKSNRRYGIIGIDNLKSSDQFNTETVVVHSRAIAKQPSPEAQPQPFTFHNQYQATTNLPSTFGPQAQAQRTEAQLQHAARNAFFESNRKPEQVLHERFTSEKSDVTIRQFLDHEAISASKQENLKHKTSKPSTIWGTSTSNNSPHSTRPLPPQPQPSLSPLDHLKLNSKQSIPPPRLDIASPVTNVSSYVRPQIETPEPSPALYRSSKHIPFIPPHIFPNTIPDRTESLLFAQDAEDNATSSQKTALGDVPALGHEKRERVPLSARIRHYDDDNDIELTNLESSLPKPRKLRRHVHGITDKTRFDESRVPQSFYTAPNRLLNAYVYARRNLKRKRPFPSSLPAPDHIHVHTGLPNFNIFTNGILLYPEICLLLAARLPIQTLINLYSISKDFHVIINQRFTTVILNQLTAKAPHAARCYPWRCFERLCQGDPSLRAGRESLASLVSQPGTTYGGANVNIKPAPPPRYPVLRGNTDADSNPQAQKNANSRPSKPCTSETAPVYRRIPTFRYLHLALHREKTIWQIYQQFAARGVPLPGHPSARDADSFVSTLHKLWFMMDIPDNPRRIAYTHSPRLFTPTDLSNTLVFIVKLDMVLNDPVGGEKRDGVRKLLFSASDGLDTLRRVLQRRDWVDELGMLRAWTRYGLQLDGEDGSERAIGGGWVPLGLSAAQHAESQSVFGIPRPEVGLLKREFWGKLTYDAVRKAKVVNGAQKGWGRKPMFLVRPDQLVLREAVRRGMVFRKQFLRALLSGYVDEESEVFARLPAADYNGGRSPVLEMEGEYEVDDVVAGVRALDVSEGGDQLLDLGDSKQGSPWTVKQYPPSKKEMDRRKQEEEQVQGFMEIWREEVRKERAEQEILRRGF